MSLASLNTAFAANEGRPMTVVHPVHRTPLTFGNDKEPVQIDLLGSDSDACVAVEHASRNDNLEAMREGAKLSAADLDLRSAKGLAKATTGWRGIPQGWIDNTEDETPAPFSQANALKLYTNKGVRWVKEQADKFIADRANFLPAAPTS